jgi:hypothetical protein
MAYLHRSAGSALVVALLCGVQTVPAQYPPGQYPPGQYPGGQYPTERRLPGGLPFPDLRLPRRQPKGKESGAKITVASVDGILRKVGQKDLLLQVRRDVLRFRLLAKTQFLDKAGDPIRDSLLQSGDQLSVQVNPDDEETAIRVVLLRGGSSTDRAAAERAVSEDSIRAPRRSDLGKPRTVSAGSGSADADSDNEAENPAPAPNVGGSGPAVGPEPAPGARDSRSMSDEEVIREAREAAASFTATLPNFVVQLATTRHFSTSGPRNWQVLHEVTAELAYANGKEEYRNMEIDGRPTDRPIEQTGAWSTGDFAITLEGLLSARTDAQFRRRGEETVGSRKALVFDFTVAEDNSNWVLVAPDKRRHTPAYKGAVWIDKETRRVLRIEQRTAAMPPDFPVGQAESILDYAYVRIDQNVYLLPSGGENTGCTSGTGACTRNVLAFRNYRRFAAASSVKF